MKKKIGKIAVLLGGPSAEREISIKSGIAVYEALLSLGLDVTCIDPRQDVVERLRREMINVVFIALHGRYGEDGVIQAILEKGGIPYTGSGPEASRLAMDKIESRRIFEKAGIPVPEYTVLNKNSYSRRAFRHPGYMPCVVKPSREGSSIGMSVVHKKSGLYNAIKNAFAYDEHIIIEKYIDGEDITVGILDEEPLPAVHIKPKKGVYDFESKYTEGMSDYIVPAKLPHNVIKEAQRLGSLAHDVLGCRCFSRVDMRLDAKGDIYVLEVNSIPGLTTTSLLPKAARAYDIDFAHLCLRIVEAACKKWTPAPKTESVYL